MSRRRHHQRKHSHREYTVTGFNKHHRTPHSRNGTATVTVPIGKHRMWHTFFENKIGEELLPTLNYWCDQRYYYTCHRKDGSDVHRPS